MVISLFQRLALPTMLVAGASSVFALPLLAMTVGCGGHENDYKPKPGPSGKVVTLPAVPTLTQKPRKQGDAYTVFGASHDLRSRVLGAKIRDKKITLFGYISKTNLAEAPRCAVHRTGKKDGPECEKAPPPVPTFWVADEKGAAESASIKIMGFASNYAKIYDAMQKYKSTGSKEIKDDAWGVDIPNPLPAKDAKVKVVGTYSTAFTKASQGTENDPLMGILTYESMTYLEPPPAPATMPGMLVFFYPKPNAAVALAFVSTPRPAEDTVQPPLETSASRGCSLFPGARENRGRRVAGQATTGVRPKHNVVLLAKDHWPPAAPITARVRWLTAAANKDNDDGGENNPASGQKLGSPRESSTVGHPRSAKAFDRRCLVSVSRRPLVASVRESSGRSTRH